MPRPIQLCGQTIDRPGHMCAFFDDDAQAYDTVIPYFRDGLEGDEAVVTIVEKHRLADHRDRLRNAGLSAPPAAVEVHSADETYLATGAFDMQRMVGFVQARLDAARRASKYVRTAGWMDWMHRAPLETKKVMEYECRMNLLVPEYDCTFMCVYDLSRLDGQTVVDIMATHPYVVLRGSVRRNPFYVPPAEYLSQLITA